MLSHLIHRLSGGRLLDPPPVVGVLRLEGPIAARGSFGQPALGLASLGPVIERVFRLGGLKAVALAINSPGGSPAQSALIHGRIRQLAAEHEVPVLAFAEDVAASGGYWLALAGDEIFATEGSIIGSIGVVSAGFGFVELLRRLGVERRLHAAGENKAMLDPFSPEDPGDVTRLEALQGDLHEVFKDVVRRHRGTRLKDDAGLFSGAIYTGRQALANGLIDGIGEMRQVLRERFGKRVRLRPLAPRRTGRWPFRRATASVALELLDALEERALWGRFGL